jgi:hypothetical protein
MVNTETKNKNCMFKNMSSEDLKEMLRLDINADSSDELDPRYILKILEVLEERDDVDKPRTSHDIDSAYESFLESYLPNTDRNGSLYDWEDASTENTCLSSTKENPSNITKRQRKFISIRRYAAVAAVFIVVSTLFFSTTAIGSSFWQSFVQWGRTTFGFSEISVSIHMNDELIPLHEALAKRDITELLAPTWIPDGFEFLDLDVYELPEQIKIAATFVNGERFLVILINVFNRQLGSTFEKNDDEVSVFHRNGIDHYITYNMDMVIVAWMNQNYECSFSGNITKGDAELIITSIYER